MGGETGRDSLGGRGAVMSPPRFSNTDQGRVSQTSLFVVRGKKKGDEPGEREGGVLIGGSDLERRKMNLR